MKKTNRFLSLALALTMAVGVSSVAFAAEADIPYDELPVKMELTEDSAQALSDYIQVIYQTAQAGTFEKENVEATVRYFYLDFAPRFAASFEDGQARLDESCTPYAAAAFYPAIFPAYVRDAATCDQWKTVESWDQFDFSSLDYTCPSPDFEDGFPAGTVEYYTLAVGLATIPFYLTFGDMLYSEYIHSTIYHGKGQLITKGILEVYAKPLWVSLGLTDIDLEYEAMVYDNGRDEDTTLTAGTFLSSYFAFTSVGDI